jgi:hypothetical protein
MPAPIALTDAQLSAVFEAARPLAVRDRDAFLQTVAELLLARPEIGDGDVHRAIVTAQRRSTIRHSPTRAHSRIPAGWHGRASCPLKPWAALWARPRKSEIL